MARNYLKYLLIDVPKAIADEDLMRHHERIMKRHEKMFRALAQFDENETIISDDEKMQKMYEYLVEKHKKMLKKLAK